MDISKWLCSIPCIAIFILLFYINDLLLPILMPGYRSDYARECLFTFSPCFVLNTAFYIVLTASIILMVSNKFGEFIDPQKILKERRYKSLAFVLVFVILLSAHIEYIMGEPFKIMMDSFIAIVSIIVLYIFMYFSQLETVK